MNTAEIVSLLVSAVALGVLTILFTILFRAYQKKQIAEIGEGKRDIEFMDQYILETDKKMRKKKKVKSILGNVFFYLLLGILIPFFAFAIANKIQGNEMMFGDETVLVVGSGSMSFKNEANPYLEENHLDNQFQTYDIIAIRKVEEADLKLYDVVAYRNHEENRIIIHRIVDIQNVDGVNYYATRGDANNATDGYIPYQDIIGKYLSFRIPFIGIFVLFFKSPSGILTFIALIYCMLMLDILSGKIEKANQKRIQTLNQLLSLPFSCQTEIYYQGVAYFFSSKGFISKKEEVCAEYPKNELVKVSTDSLGKQKVEVLLKLENKEEITNGKS